MKRLALAAAMGLSLPLPAVGETLASTPVVVELRTWCIEEKRAEGMEAPAPYCNCVMGQAKLWADAAQGRERQARLWTIRFEVLPIGVSPEVAYAGAAEAGLERSAFDDDLLVHYRTLDTFYAMCVPRAHGRRLR